MDIILRFDIKRDIAIEFGVEFGYSTSALANYFDYVIGVDTFTGDKNSGFKEDHFIDRKNDLCVEFSNIKLIQSDYKDFIAPLTEDRYDLIHIDIVHSYTDTFNCGAWAVNHSDCVLFHDTIIPEVRLACYDLASEYGFNFFNYGYSNGLAILIKPKAF